MLALTTITLAAATLLAVPGAHAAYNLVQAWEGESFFDDWDFYGSYDNLTNVSPLYFGRMTAFNPDAGRHDLGRPISRNHRPPGICRQRRKGYHQSRQRHECLV